jgi:HlyD family type I secretion membrane fusion protein
MSTSRTKKAKPFTDKPTFWSGMACLVGVGGFMIWGAFAPLSEGVTSAGQIVVEDNRKVVQHLEGGIIRVLNVQEGDIVSEGDILIELEQVASLAQRDEVANELAIQLASVERLTALINNEPQPDFENIKTLPVPEAVMSDIIFRQEALYIQQKASLESEVSVLSAKRNTLKARERDLSNQISAVERSLLVASQDLANKRKWLAQKLETIDRVQAVEREVSNLEAELSRLITEQNQARITAREVSEEIKSVRAQALASQSAELLEAKRLASTAQERLSASQDILSRTVIKAPRSGKVLNLVFNTIGGVVSPGEPVMEIVPDTSGLIAEVRINPTDRDAVQAGQIVKAQLSAYKLWRTPRIDGEVVSISADLIEEPETGLTYYEARILLDRETLKSEYDVNIIPGMPVEAFIDSGIRRTFFDIILEPISSTIERGTKVS